MKALAMIPTFNESQNIKALIEEVLKQEKEIEVLVVDDFSPDGTWKIVREMERKNPRVHLLLRKENKGRGFAGIAGFKWAIEKAYDPIIEMDADFSHQPKYISEFLKAVKEADVVLGSRFVKGGKDIGRGKFRENITKFANSYIRFVLGLKLRDCTSGYRCFRKNVLEKIDLNRMVSTGPAIVQEILYTVYLEGFKIKEIPIEFVDRRQGETKLNWKALVKGFNMVLRLRIAKALNKV